jgi:hypothetical protein
MSKDITLVSECLKMCLLADMFDCLYAWYYLMLVEMFVEYIYADCLVVASNLKNVLVLMDFQLMYCVSMNLMSNSH